MADEIKSVFATLNAVNANDHTEKKNNLTYLSWAWAWAEVKTYYPDANYTIYENANGWNYHTDGRTCWVKTGVTINGLEHIEYLPVMNHRNQSIPANAVTSFDVNKAIQRSLTKACARHGLGLYIYAGEDLPEEAKEEAKKATAQAEINEAADVSVNAIAARQRLVAFLKEIGVDTKEAGARFKLTNSSTATEYNIAYEYYRQLNK